MRPPGPWNEGGSQDLPEQIQCSHICGNGNAPNELGGVSCSSAPTKHPLHYSRIWRRRRIAIPGQYSSPALSRCRAQKGTLRSLGREKSAALADFLEARLSDLQILTTSPPPSQICSTERSSLPTHQTFLCDRRPKLTSAGRLPLKAPYNRPISGDFNALSQEEACKALPFLASKKAPAPDGLKWDLCRSLTSYDPLQYHHAHWALPDLPSASLPDPS